MLEPVELEGGQRVDGRDLVFHEDPASRPRHPDELGHGALGPGYVVKCPAGAGEVERAVLERKARRVPLDEGDVRGSERPRPLEQLGDDVYAHDLPDERRERQRERPGAGAAVECALVPTRNQERPKLVADELDLPLGMVGDALSCPAEARADFPEVGLSQRRAGSRAAGRTRSRRRARR
jgi:hypothetical protein